MTHVFRLVLSVAVLAILFPAAAQGDSGYWRITGTVVNIDNEVSPISCQKSNVRLRLRSRWSNGNHTWGPTWGETTTGSQGQFSKQSYWFADISRGRDIRIEAQKMGEWIELAILNVSGATPHQSQGNVSIFDTQPITTTEFDCPFKDSDQIRLRPSDPLAGLNGKKPKPSAKINPMRCGLGPNGSSNVDLQIVASEIRQRDNRPNDSRKLVTWEVSVRNNGIGTYVGSGNCLTRVLAVFSIPELSSDRREYDVELEGEIGPGETRKFATDGNFGLGPESSTSYNVLFTVDPENKIVETDEQNNRQPGCYTPATQTYVDSPCTASRVISSPKKQSTTTKSNRKKYPTVRRSNVNSQAVIRNRYIQRKK